MKILVTGASSLIGFNLLQNLRELDHEVYSFYFENKPLYGSPIRINLTDSEELVSKIRNVKPEVIIHLAAFTNVDKCESEKKLASSINSNATKIIVKEASKQGAFLLYISTDYVFDGKKGNYKENDLPNPINFYGKTKLDGEIAIQEDGAFWAIARTSTPFGLHNFKKSFPIWLIENLQQKKEVNIVTDQFTSPTYTQNLSRMLIEITTKKLGGIWHTAGASRISRFEFAKLICEQFNLDNRLIKPVKLNEIDWLAERPIDSSLNVTKTKNLLKEKPLDIENSIKSLANDFTSKKSN